jgi:hypothetical protein
MLRRVTSRHPAAGTRHDLLDGPGRREAARGWQWREDSRSLRRGGHCGDLMPWGRAPAVSAMRGLSAAPAQCGRGGS